MIEKFKTNAEVIENGDKYLYGNHVRMPISMERGEGVYVFDKDGNKYLDFVGGIAVNGLGHCHPAIVKCLQERAETILHCSNYFYNEPAVQTAKLIVENSCFDKVLFANSGAEANEGQIKLARKYAKDHGHPERFVVITMKNSIPTSKLLCSISLSAHFTFGSVCPSASSASRNCPPFGASTARIVPIPIGVD